jgi:cell division protease FtsH
MILDAWLPIGYRFPNGVQSGMILHEGSGWQIVKTQGCGRALVISEDLAARWIASGLISAEVLTPFAFGRRTIRYLACDPGRALAPVGKCEPPINHAEALAFAVALRETRKIDKKVSLQNALYIEEINRLLPTFSPDAGAADDILLGCWLTGGVAVSVKSFSRLRQLMAWVNACDLREVVETAGFEVDESVASEMIGEDHRKLERGEGCEDNRPRRNADNYPNQKFELPGRQKLEAFFNEHIVEIVQNRERYRTMGIGFPSTVVLHGPPGCGKTFAVERLVEFLRWPDFRIDSSSVASPYIHETARKIAEVFDKAIENAPSVLVIDEMEAFLSNRDLGHGHYRIEEVAEFLRRIPDAARHGVLIIAMTNRLDMIDPAIMRRGRFDHVIDVDYPCEEEMRSLLEHVLADVPKEKDINLEFFSKKLSGRPLSDVAFVVREGARLAARSGRDKLDRESLSAALASAHRRKGGGSRPIGFS